MNTIDSSNTFTKKTNAYEKIRSMRNQTIKDCFSALNPDNKIKDIKIGDVSFEFWQENSPINKIWIDIVRSFAPVILIIKTDSPILKQLNTFDLQSISRIGALVIIDKELKNCNNILKSEFAATTLKVVKDLSEAINLSIVLGSSCYKIVNIGNIDDQQEFEKQLGKI